MPIDLYDCCRTLERCARSHPDDFRRWELAELGRELLRHRPGREELLALTARMLELESGIPDNEDEEVMEMLLAVEEDDYQIRLPGTPSQLPAWPFHEGYLYIATAWSRPGLTRFSATYDDPATHLAKYAERYGYPLDLHRTLRVRHPHTLEREISLALLAGFHGARSDAYGDSLSWYCLPPEALTRHVLDALVAA